MKRSCHPRGGYFITDSISDRRRALRDGLCFPLSRRPEISYLEKAVHFLNELKKSRCRQFKEYCWGYPFDWVTRGGMIKQQTPLITTTPYVYEAFLQVFELRARRD